MEVNWATAINLWLGEGFVAPPDLYIAADYSTYETMAATWSGQLELPSKATLEGIYKAYQDKLLLESLPKNVKFNERKEINIWHRQPMRPVSPRS